MQKRATIHDIAKLLNITSGTVSRALHNDTRVKALTKKKVLDAAKKLNYKPNTNASNLRTGDSKIIGVIVPQMDINFFSNVIVGIEEVASKNNYNLIICQSNDLYEKEKASVETLIKQNVACIILSLAGGTENTEHLVEAVKHNIPLIQFDRTDENLLTDRVVNEIDNIVMDMMQHLFDQGYRDIAYMAGPQNIDIFKKRRTAFEKSLEKLGLPYDAKKIISYDLSRASAKKAAEKLLTRKKRPDAIFASSDFGALGAWEVSKEMGLRVPEELGICGFSNEFYTEITKPSITTVNQFSKEMGQAASRIFFESLHRGAFEKPQTVVITPELIIRESTTRLPKKANH